MGRAERNPSRQRMGFAKAQPILRSVERMRGMPGVAALILMPHVGDQRFGALGLDLEGGDERVFGIDQDAVGVSFQPEPDGEMHRQLLDPLRGTEGGRSTRPSPPKIRHSPRAKFPKLPDRRKHSWPASCENT